MSDTKQQRIIAGLNFFGGISGILAIATLIFYGGAMVERLRAVEIRVNVIEAQGSPTCQQHIATDNERFTSEERRMSEMEVVLKQYAAMAADIREIKTEIKYLRGVKP